MRQCEVVVSHFLTKENKAWNEAKEKKNAEGEKVNCRNEGDATEP